MRIEPNDVMIVVDVQNDFCPDGALGVNEGDEVIPLINELTPRFQHCVFTRDWHPPNHCSFKQQPEFVDDSWPVHCVADTHGAAFHPDLHVPEGGLIISKGTDPDKEAYSGFEGTDLDTVLRRCEANRLFVCGLATDYCVLRTALDGVKNGWNVLLIEDACRGVDIPPGTVEKALQEMEQAGVKRITSKDIK